MLYNQAQIWDFMTGDYPSRFLISVAKVLGANPTEQKVPAVEPWNLDGSALGFMLKWPVPLYQKLAATTFGELGAPDTTFTCRTN